jgi:hypothetical protein
MDLDSDLIIHSKNISKITKFNDIFIDMVLIEYNKELAELLNNWNICVKVLKKEYLFKTKKIFSIIYCLLSDCYNIVSLNNQSYDIDLFNIILDKFLRFDIVNINRNIKLKSFTICDSMVIIDCYRLDKYKIYELFNINSIKKYYDTNIIDFDILIRDINIKPVFVGSIDNLEEDYKKLSIINYKYDHQQIINNLKNMVKYQNNMEKKIVSEYKKLKFIQDNREVQI